MKTTLKKTMAALSAAAVVAASAAVMAIPTSAAGMSLTIGSATLTESELKAANYEVTLPIGSTAEFNSVGVGVTLQDGLSYVKKGMKVTADGASGLAVESFVFMPFSYATVPLEALPAGQFAQITVQVPSTAKAGDVFNLTIAGKDSDGTVMEYKNGVTGETGEAGSGAGTITIVADATKPTEAPTEAPTTAPVATGTTAATTTTKKAAAKSTSSPKTGDALPVAGVAVAVAVIGGVALVAKKRK